MGMGSKDSGERDEQLAKFRAAIAGMLDGAVDSHDVTKDGAAGIYLTTMVAARETIFGENPNEAMADEFARLAALNQSTN